jgi:type I restriction enzyme S subunit
MPIYSINLDRETSERAGAGGHFQVVSIEDASGNDLTDELVDVGTHFPSLDAVQETIAAKIGLPASDIELIEE